MNSALINPWKCSQIDSEYFLMSCLDIYPNLIVMGYPVETTLESMYMNPMESVVK